MRTYGRLAQYERYQIDCLLRSEQTLREIGRLLNRSASTISRELRRNGPDYSPRKAQMRASKKLRERKFHRKIKGPLRQHIERKIRQDWSPEQIVGRMRLERGESEISHEGIYLWIRRRAAQGDRLWIHLRLGRKFRRKRSRSKKEAKNGKIPNRTWISERPEVVEKRERLGDYERDTVLGTFNGAVILSIADRTSRRVKVAKLAKKLAEKTHKATVKLLKGLPKYSMTNDNGKEFAHHEKTAKELGIKVYFAHPHHSWERGTNENINGLIRQYFPRRMNLARVTKKEIKFVEKRLNSRPRKCLDYKTPDEVHREKGPLH